MHENIGILKEKEIVNALNNKKIKELSNNSKYIVKELFGIVDENEIVYASLIDGFKKPDFVITLQNESHYISMKSGRSNVVHQENIRKFCLYLHHKGISNTTISTILLFHYGDGTKDGSGKQRIEYEELLFRLKDRIKAANDELNKNKEFVWDVIVRTVFKGTLDDNIEADYLYHGDAEYGVLASKKQIYSHFLKRDWKYYSNLHIGPIHIRPHARYVNKDIKRPDSREKIDFAWINLHADIDYISSRYNG